MGTWGPLKQCSLTRKKITRLKTFTYFIPQHTLRVSKMSESTFHTTGEDVRKMESRESKFHDGKTPKDSDTSAMKSILSEQESKEAEIDRVKANLPLPEQPVGGASADLRAVNVGSGGVNVKLGTHSSDGLREPATAESSARVDGSEWKKETAP